MEAAFLANQLVIPHSLSVFDREWIDCKAHLLPYKAEDI